MKTTGMKRTSIPRRAMLRGLAGGAAALVGLPILDAMLNGNGTAFADETPLPVRLVTWFFGNGVLLNRWVPGGIRKPVTGANYPLSEQLTPLAPVKDYLSVASGFHNKSMLTITHHEGMAVYSGYTMTDLGSGQGIFSNARGPTIDQVYAQHLATQPDKPAIVGGIHMGVVMQVSQVDYGTTMHNVSHAGHLKPNPPIKNPQQIHKLFLDLFTPPEDPSKPTRLSVTSAVMADAKALQKRLGIVDKKRIDGHLAALHDLETKIKALPPVCPLPGEPTVTSDVTDGIPAVNAAMSDLLAFALSCDVTRIGTILFAGGASEAPLKAGLESQHMLSHSAYHNALPFADSPGAPAYTESGQVSEYNQGIVFAMEQLSYMLQKFRETPDAAGGNLLDNAVVFISSDCSDGFSHSLQDHPMLLCGRAAGRLKYPGIHIRASGGRNASDVTLTALQAAYPEAASVGALDYEINGMKDQTYSSTPVVELKAG